MSNDSTKEFKRVVVEGIAMYPCVHVPQKAFAEGEPPSYKLDIVLEPEEAKKLTQEGMKPAKTMVDEDTKKLKEYPEFPGKPVFSLRRRTVKRDGTPRSPLKVTDAETNEIPPEVLIGNGSRVRCSINPYTMHIAGKKVVGHTLLGVQVLDLVPYEAKERDNGLTKTVGFNVKMVQPNSTKVLQSSTEEDDSSPFDDD